MGMSVGAPRLLACDPNLPASHQPLCSGVARYRLRSERSKLCHGDLGQCSRMSLTLTRRDGHDSRVGTHVRTSHEWTIRSR
jgi:hypothetical protein